MLKTTQDFLNYEASILAPYATKSIDTKGRKYIEFPHSIRTDFQRDRDRILHSRAFRRLEYKTQVFLNGAGDHYRTRLTHTIEVAAIARTISRALGLNEDLAETIALAHDIGHPPFGHTGEYKLNELMSEYNGYFDHNEHSLKLVDELIEKYPNFKGLNLCWESRVGLVKHRKESTYLDGVKLLPMASLESQVADIADDLTYYGHDVDDGLDSGLINEKELEELSIWQEASELSAALGSGSRLSSHIIRCLIDSMVKDLILQSDINIVDSNLKTPEDAQYLTVKTIRFSNKYQETTDELKSFLYSNLYKNEEVMKVNRDSSIKLGELFKFYMKNPDFENTFIREQSKKDSIAQSVCYYLAGMTDRFALCEYERHCK